MEREYAIKSCSCVRAWRPASHRVWYICVKCCECGSVLIFGVDEMDQRAQTHSQTVGNMLLYYYFCTDTYIYVIVIPDRSHKNNILQHHTGISYTILHMIIYTASGQSVCNAVLMFMYGLFAFLSVNTAGHLASTRILSLCVRSILHICVCPHGAFVEQYYCARPAWCRLCACCCYNTIPLPHPEPCNHRTDLLCTHSICCVCYIIYFGCRFVYVGMMRALMGVVSRIITHIRGYWRSAKCAGRCGTNGLTNRSRLCVCVWKTPEHILYACVVGKQGDFHQFLNQFLTKMWTTVGNMACTCI